ncbi:MAG: transporter substrate-binding domain-containing protein [Bacteroidetes bacterium]|nr:transporter substrate-binding domain-containing protein [Bacteroidota bacterium]
MLNRLFIVSFLLFVLASCKSMKSKNKFYSDLNEIRKKGKLTVLFENSSLSYFEYRGKKMGFEYEILDSFSRFIGLPLEIKVVSDSKEFDSYLNNGEGDIIAANLAVSLSQKESFNFSVPYYFTHQVLIQRESEEPVRDPLDLSNKTVYVRQNSAFSRRLHCLQEEIGEHIRVKSKKNDPITEDLIEMVANNQIDYTVSHENLARISKELHDNLNIKTSLSFKQKIAFGLRHSSPQLKKKLDEFITKYSSSSHFVDLKKRYFDYLKEIPNDLILIKRGQISPYDAIFKKEAAKYGWDWRFIAAVAFKESRFNPNARGFGGAFGLMQFMPNTGSKYGVGPGSSPEIQIAAGMKLINNMFNSWSSIPDKEQRMKFTLASYNAGKGHIDDAQRLASEYGLNPKMWDENVAVMVQKLAQPEFYRSPLVKCGAYRGHATSYAKSVFDKYKQWSGN